MKKYIFINTIIIFLLGFITHFGYDIFPNTITSIFFPVNESIFEHMKLIITSYYIYLIIRYLIYKKNNLNTNNLIFKTTISLLTTIIIFLIIYLPIYYSFGENIFITLIIYFISILISESIYINKFYKQNKYLNIISIILILIIYIVTTYLTYNPIKIDFFLDPMTKKYGI
ncbi:MAG: DUF6512 family protein [Bacilli bacterium]